MESTWFDRLLSLLLRMDTSRLVLLRDVVTALAERRLADERAAHATIEDAILYAVDKN